MENWNNQNDEQQNLHSDNWQMSENDKDLNTYDSFNMNSAEADGYGIDPNTADDALYTLGDDDDDDVDSDDSEEEETSKRDWGSVDPLSDTDGLPSGVDPSGPGSAV